MRRIACGLLGIALGGSLAACGQSPSAAPETVTVVASATPTRASSTPSSVSATASALASISSTTDPSPASSALSTSAIRSIRIELEHGNVVGENLYQLSKWGSTELPTFSWYSRSENGDLEGMTCGVVIDVTGPGDFDERHRSPECSGYLNGLPSVKLPGEYTFKVEVTPQNGAPIQATRKISVIPYGS